MKPVWFSDDLSFEKKKIPLDYHVTIGSALTSKMTNYVSHLKKGFEYTVCSKFPSGTKLITVYMSR